MKTRHFTSGNYTTIRNNVGSYSFLGVGKSSMLEHHTRLFEQAARIQREIAALTTFLDGDSISDPDALR